MSTQHNTSPLSLVRRAGMALFLAAFIGFVGLLTYGGFAIDDAAWNEIEQSGRWQDWHKQPFLDAIGELRGQSWSTPFGFVPAINAAIDKADEAMGDGVQFQKWDRQPYGLELARISSKSPIGGREGLFLFLTVGLACIGGLLYALPRVWLEPAGIKNNGIMFSQAKSRGWIGIGVGVFLIGLYIALYFHPAYIANWIRLTDPATRLISGNPDARASQWFFYGFLYTLSILVMGVRMMVHYRHSRYHLLRTVSIIFFQTGFAFLIPEILVALNKPWFDFKNAWPLNYTFFHGWSLDQFQNGGALGWFMLFWGIGLSLLLIPLLAAFFGKRWYCSWVCGCGGLAETLGDPYRHLSDKSLKAWKIERWLIHGVLVFAVVMTGATLANYLSEGKLLAEYTGPVQEWYGFLIGSIFAGVVGTGFYPFMGNRVWCRFGCPLAAILGIVQKYKSRFRITTNGGQCISCGNCSTYCEMGIDVRAYAQRGQNIIRASCVGCGVCAAVCPRGVLRLENGPEEGRYNEVSLLQIGDGKIDAA